MRGALILAFVGGVTLVSAQEAGLSRAAIEEAIEFGISGDPKPYLLRHRLGEGTNQVVLGAIYTPFLRVALASRAAWAEHRQLAPDDVPAAIAAQELLIAVRWDFASRCHPDEPSDPPEVVAITPRWRTPASFATGVQPSRISLGTSLIAPYGALPYDHIVMVVTYPMTFLRSDVDFVIAKRWDGGGCFVTGRMPAAELSSWR